MRFLMTGTAIPISLSLAFIVSCTAPEEQIVDRFLTAVRDGQEDIAQGVSLVSLTDADFETWEIVEVGPEATEAFRFVELRDAYREADQAWESKVADNDKFMNDNRDNALRYEKEVKSDPDYEFTAGEMAEYQKEWEARMAELRELEQNLKEADEALKKERDSIYMSANMAVRDTFEGDVAVKNVRVNVDGSSGSKTYDLTLRKYNLVDSETGITPMSRWIVTEIEG